MCCPKDPPVRENAKIREPEMSLECEDPLRRMLSVQFPPEFEMMDLWVHEDCIHNQLRAIKGRVLGVVPEPLEPILPLLLGPTVKMISESLTPEPASSLEELVLRFPQNRRKRYEKALEVYLSCGLEEKSCIITAFVKAEKLPILETDKDPRMIQARGIVFNLLFAQVTKPVEDSHKYYRDPHTNLRIVAKGMNLDQRAHALKSMWNLYRDPMALSLDLSRWDMHVQVPLILQVMGLYRYHTQDPLLEYCISRLLDNICWTNKRINYRVPGGVMSGDMTTALGNCIAVTVIAISFRDIVGRVATEPDSARQLLMGMWPRNTPLHELWLSFIEKTMEHIQTIAEHVTCPAWLSILDDGDDHVIITETHLYPVLRDLLPIWWKIMGHKLTVEGYTTEFNNILFCQHKPFTGVSRTTMVPDPRKVISKSTTLTGKYMEDPRAYLRTVWTARAVLHRDIPILGPFFHKNALSLGYGPMMEVDTREFQHVNSSLHYLMVNTPEDLCLPREQVISEEDRHLMCRMWGFDPTLQLYMEDMVVGLPKLHEVQHRRPQGYL